MKRRYIDGIDQIILDHVDAIEFISRYVDLKKAGKNYQGLCPFHNEKTPSFFVSEGKQLYHCFGCGAGGNVINFVQEIENLEFIDAIEFLAKKTGIDLERYATDDSDYYSDYKEKNDLYLINRMAAIYFYRNLSKHEKVLTYLNKRKIDKKTIKTFGLGYSLDSWDGLINHMKSQNISLEHLKKAGLVSESNQKTYDKFRDRLMFPIFDVKDNILGFGGRVISDDVQGPKYLNSPETKIFNKSNTLYALNIAKKNIRHNKKIILVEGYMDVIMLNKFGIKNVVAALGTSFTKQHAQLLNKYTDEVVVCFDADEAGVKATRRALTILSGVIDRVKVIALENNQDPDDYINTYGKEKFTEKINDAQPMLSYLIDQNAQQFDLTTEYGLSDFIKESKNILKTVDDLSKAYFYVNKISEVSNLPKDMVAEEIFGPDYKKVKRNLVNSQRNQQTDEDPNTTTFIKYDKLYEYEKKLLQIALHDSEGFKIIKENYPIEQIFNEDIKNIFLYLKQYYVEHKTIDFDHMLENLELDEVKIAKALMKDPVFNQDIKKDIYNFIKKIKVKKIDNEITRLKGIRKNLSEGDDLNKNIIKETKLKNKKREIYNSLEGGESID